jgi:hypothetical protein
MNEYAAYDLRSLDPEDAGLRGDAHAPGFWLTGSEPKDAPAVVPCWSIGPDQEGIRWPHPLRDTWAVSATRDQA